MRGIATVVLLSAIAGCSPAVDDRVAHVPAPAKAALPPNAESPQPDKESKSTTTLDLVKAHGDARTIDLLVKAGAREPAATRSVSTPPLPRRPSPDEFPDPWRPKWDPGSHM